MPRRIGTATGCHGMTSSAMSWQTTSPFAAPRLQKPLEDRETFLEATRDAEPLDRTIVPGSIRVWESGTVAAVSSVVELEGRPEQFTNTRVFTAGGRYGWLCNWWQVTAAQADSSRQ